jgi:D-alanine transaminase
VYEVVRVYDGRLFRAVDHWRRLQNSLAALEIRDVAAADAAAISETLLERNNLRTGDALIYLQITRGVAPRKHPFPEPAVPPTVYGYAAPFAPPRDQWRDGIRTILAPDNRWARCDLKTVSLLPNVLANQRAHAAGAAEAIFVRDGIVMEGSHSNFAAVRDGTLITHPESNYILGGITRRAVLELCRGLQIPVREFPLAEHELSGIAEAMMLGTTTEVMPVVQINDRRIGDGRPGPVTRRLQDAFRKLVESEKAGGAEAR